MLDLYLKIKDETLAGMHSYMQGCIENGTDPGYDQEAITQCESILIDFVFALTNAAPGDQGAVQDAVMEAVLALNRLNETCRCTLIESEQRDELIAFINRVAADRGVGDGGTDLTEPWREW